MITEVAFGEEVLSKVYEFAFEEYDRLPKIFTQIFDVEPSAQNGWLLGNDSVMDITAKFDDAPGGTVRGRVVEGYPFQISVRDLRATLDIKENTIEDLGEGDVDAWAQRLGRAAAQSFVAEMEEFHAAFFNYGAWAAGWWVFENIGHGGINPLDDSSGDLIYDGKAFFATDHPMKAHPGSLQNYTASAPLTVANLKAELIKFQSTYAYDNAYRKIRRRAQMLMVPTALEYTAQEILTSANIPYEMTNTANVLSGTLQLVVNPYLTDSDGWFIGTKMIPGLVSIYHPNYPPMTADMPMPFRIEQPRKVETGMYQIDLKTRIGAGVRNWRSWHACNIAST